MIKFTITAEQLEKVLNYLVQKPWGEVNELVAIMTKLEKLSEKSAEAGEEKGSKNA